VTVTVAVPDFVGSATDVAVTVTNDGLGGVAGAVYKPPVVILPQDGPPQPNPVTLQVTPVLVDPVTVALNCCCAPVLSSTLPGDTLTLTTEGAITVTVVEPEIAWFDSDVALTLTIFGVGALDGAVYRPVDVMEPQAMPEHPLPDMLQTTMP